MTRSTIPPEIRRLAVLCSLLHLTWIVIICVSIAIVSGSPNLIKDIGTAVLLILLLPPFSLIVSRILALIVWLTSCRRHPFIYESGKEALNFSLSIDLYLLIVGAIVFASCGFYPVPMIGVLVHLWLLMPLLSLFHFCLMIAGTIKTSFGLIYKYPVTINFFN
jgi:uncharacterized Tic20 family protein